MICLTLYVADDYGVPLPWEATEPAFAEVGDGAAAGFGCAEPLKHFLYSTILQPLGHHLAQVRASRDVGVHVVCDVDASCPRALDRLDHYLRGVEDAAVDDRHVGVLYGDARGLSDVDGLFDCADVVVSPESCVAGVEGPLVWGDGAGDLDEFLGGGVASGREREAGREAEGSLLDGLGGETTHGSKLVRRRCAVVEEPGGGAKGCVTDLVCDVDADAVRLQELGVSVVVGPRPLDFG